MLLLLVDVYASIDTYTKTYSSTVPVTSSCLYLTTYPTESLVSVYYSSH